MRTIQMTIDEDLLAVVDRVVKKLNTTRSAFTRKALRDAVKKVNVSTPGKKHKKGSRHYPIGKTKSFELDL